MKDPATIPVVPEIPQLVTEKAPARFGVMAKVQRGLAVEAKPLPVTATTVPVVPVVGDTTTNGTTVKLADAPAGISLPGVPFTVTIHAISDVE